MEEILEPEQESFMETMAEESFPEEEKEGTSASLIGRKVRFMEGDAEVVDDEEEEEKENKELYELSLTMANCFPLEASIRRRLDPKTGKMVESVAAGSPMGEEIIQRKEMRRRLDNLEALNEMGAPIPTEDEETEERKIRWELLRDHGIRVPADEDDIENPDVEVVSDWVFNRDDPPQPAKYVLPNMDDPQQVNLLRFQKGIVSFDPEMDKNTGKQSTYTPRQAATSADGTRLFQLSEKDIVDLFNVRKIQELWIEPSIYRAGMEYHAEHLEVVFRNSPMIPGIICLPHLFRIFNNIPHAQSMSSYDLVSHYLLILESLKGKHRFIDAAYKDVRKYEVMEKDQAKYKVSDLTFPEDGSITRPSYFDWTSDQVHAFIFKTFGSMTPTEYTAMMENEEAKEFAPEESTFSITDGATKDGDEEMDEALGEGSSERKELIASYKGEFELKPVEESEEAPSLSKLYEDEMDIKRSAEKAAIETELLRKQEEEKRKAQIRKDLERLSHISTAGMKQKDVYRWAILNRIESNGQSLDEFYQALRDIMCHYIVAMELPLEGTGIDSISLENLTLEQCFAHFKGPLCSNVYFLKDIWILQSRYTHRFISELEKLILILCQRWIPPVRKTEDMYNWDMICSVPVIDPTWSIGRDGEETLVTAIDVLEKNSDTNHPYEIQAIIKGMTQDRAKNMGVPESCDVVDDSDLVFGRKDHHRTIPTYYQMKIYVNWLEYCKVTLEDETRNAEIYMEHERMKGKIEQRAREALENGRSVIRHFPEVPETKDQRKKRSRNKRKAAVRARRGM
jgi:hypothetical protein